MELDTDPSSQDGSVDHPFIRPMAFKEVGLEERVVCHESFGF
jgi:hypothetical protein